MTAASRAMAQSDFFTAALCENLMNGRDPFAGFPGANAASGARCEGREPGGEAMRPNPFATAHNAAIDRLCMNFMSGDFTLTGVDQTYRDTLAIEEELR